MEQKTTQKPKKKEVKAQKNTSKTIRSIGSPSIDTSKYTSGFFLLIFHVFEKQSIQHSSSTLHHILKLEPTG